MPTAKRCLYAGCASLVLLAGCSDSASRKPLTQVAARVDGEEISIHQINALLPQMQEMPAASGGAPEATRKAVLDRLIDRQVIYAQALERKVDRDPKVVMLIDAARREIVARAYLDALLASPPAIAPVDIHQYYVENPALFARRRIYTLDGLVLAANPDELEPVKRMIGAGSDVRAIGGYLRAHGVEFTADSGVRKAEQIPLDVLPSLSMAADGSTTLIDSGQRYYVYHLVSSQLAPVDEASARPRIATFLANQQGQRMVAQEVKRLKANARIEYLGDFAKPEAGKPGNTVATLK
ncbi:MAG: EpsD family peptidyl-prolyl cis-trans isomerase [Rhodocyclaceae bacterium]|nr:EpsD family peptidyl-prolyl cis-trans isomerase [Rhodocyclaceae bacterium]